jgi:D-tagatose-1,6-bisphosphate aldolase subunit GatZ/KbaZ
MGCVENMTSKRDAGNFPLDQLVQAQKRGVALGITSVCSANPFVIEASLLFSKVSGAPVLIESTCNQVNQYGGYTGMRPLDFMGYLEREAFKVGFPFEQVILGGDHLGPNVWRDENAEEAMDNARLLVRDYVHAGYTKIHLDASMCCGDDPLDVPLDKQVSAGRTAELARVAEDAFGQCSTNGISPRYVIGTEVPAPGGIQSGDESISVTPAAEVEETIHLTKEEFYKRGLEDAWDRVIAVVVQPGVEYGDQIIYEYRSDCAAELSRVIEDHDHLVYEAHSTDYQTREALKQLVRDHFAILKVGPALTFAFREAIFALSMIEKELLSDVAVGGEVSNLFYVLEQVMLDHPEHWEKYHTGGPEQQRFARKYSFSDRSRYYWPDPSIQEGLNRLLTDLSQKPIPLALLSQYLPVQYHRVREGQVANNPQALILDKITAVLSDYSYACGYGGME